MMRATQIALRMIDSPIVWNETRINFAYEFRKPRRPHTFAATPTDFVVQPLPQLELERQDCDAVPGAARPVTPASRLPPCLSKRVPTVNL